MTFNFPNPDVLYFNRNEHHTNRALASDITNQIWSDRIHLSNFARLVAVDPTAYSNEKVSLYALALGHEDLNDHRELRHDLALQTAANRVESLASPSTLCRLEQRADRDTAWAIHEVLFEQFVAAHPVPPRRLILDFDATDTPLHGEQEDRFFHTYYGGYCYLPLYVFCGRPVPAIALRLGLHLDRGTAPPGAVEHDARHRQPEPHPLDLVEDRRGGAAQHPPHPAAVE